MKAKVSLALILVFILSLAQAILSYAYVQALRLPSTAMSCFIDCSRVDESCSLKEQNVYKTVLIQYNL
jgi:hypothetical protein